MRRIQLLAALCVLGGCAAERRAPMEVREASGPEPQPEAKWIVAGESQGAPLGPEALARAFGPLQAAPGADEIVAASQSESVQRQGRRRPGRRSSSEPAPVSPTFQPTKKITARSEKGPDEAEAATRVRSALPTEVTARDRRTRQPVHIDRAELWAAAAGPWVELAFVLELHHRGTGPAEVELLWPSDSVLDGASCGPADGDRSALATVLAPAKPTRTFGTLRSGRRLRVVCRTGRFIELENGRPHLKLDLPKLPRSRPWRIQAWARVGEAWQRRLGPTQRRKLAFESPSSTVIAEAPSGRWLLTAWPAPKWTQAAAPSELLFLVDRSRSARLQDTAEQARRILDLPRLRRFGALFYDVSASWWMQRGFQANSMGRRNALLGSIAAIRAEGGRRLASVASALKRADSLPPGLEVAWLGSHGTHWEAGGLEALSEALRGRRFRLRASASDRDGVALAVATGGRVWRPGSLGAETAPASALVRTMDVAGKQVQLTGWAVSDRTVVAATRVSSGAARSGGPILHALARLSLEPRPTQPPPSSALAEPLKAELTMAAPSVRRAPLESRPYPRSGLRVGLERRHHLEARPSYWLELARARAAEGDSAGAVRALSMLGTTPGAERARMAAFGLLALGQPELAAELLGRVTPAAEVEVGLQLERALSLHRAGRWPEAAALYEVVLSRPAAGASRVLAERHYRRLLSRVEGPEASARRARLSPAATTPLTVSLHWSSPRFDLDLWVLEPNGHRAVPGASSPLGGRHPWNVADGRGPEVYFSPETPGVYDALIRAVPTASAELPTCALMVIDNGGQLELRARWIPPSPMVSAVASAEVGARPEVTSTLP